MEAEGGDDHAARRNGRRAQCRAAKIKGLIHWRCKVLGSMLIKLLKLLFYLASRLSGYEVVMAMSHSRWFHEHQQ
jgi:hypothetical protein